MRILKQFHGCHLTRVNVLLTLQITKKISTYIYVCTFSSLLPYTGRLDRVICRILSAPKNALLINLKVQNDLFLICNIYYKFLVYLVNNSINVEFLQIEGLWIWNSLFAKMTNHSFIAFLQKYLENEQLSDYTFRFF